MDLLFFLELLKALVWNPNNILLSIPTYLAIVLIVLPVARFLFPEWEGKMNQFGQYLRTHRGKLIVTLVIISLLVGSYSAYENKQPNFALPSELLASQISNQKIRIWDLVPVYSSPTVSGKVFEDNDFYGPAVISIHPNNVGDLAIITEAGVTIDTALIATLNDNMAGVIIFDGNVFKGINKLHNISIIGSPEMIQEQRAKLRESLGGSNVAPK